MTSSKPFIIISKKSYRRAVDRNKLKRRIRAIIRKWFGNISSSVTFVAKKGDLELPFKDLEIKVKKVLARNK